DGHGLISQPDLGYELECRATGAPYCLVYCPVGEDFFCFEPVSHPVNAHHLPGRPGLHLLHKGQSAGLALSLGYRPLRGIL
ncbi:aldose 1-epimerase, partial [Pseudomonas fragi]|nr:aldose 1-epimerase [Pseudomonas sp. GC01]